MEEARRVLERLRGIERLELAGGDPQELLVELGELDAEVDRWLEAEPAGTAAAAAALARFRAALPRPREVMRIA